MSRIAARIFGRLGVTRMSGSLGAQLMLILTGVGLLGSLAIAGLLTIVITPSFNRLETAAVTASIERTQTALNDVATRVEIAARDYGDRNMIGAGTVVASDGRIIATRWIGRGGNRPELDARLAAAARGLRLPVLLAKARSRSFYMRIGDRLVAVGVAQAPRGYVLMARELTSAQLAGLLRSRARIDLSAPSPDVTRHAERLRLDISVPILGADGASIGSVRFTVPRDLSMLGRQTLVLAVAGAILLILIVLTVLRRMIGRQVLQPLHRVERHMGLVRASGALDPLIEDARADEIGRLVASFNAMLRQLKDLREQVEVQSFTLGQSERAVAVMHNVRNALGPIATILSQDAPTPASDLTLVNRAIGELAIDDILPARRRKLAAFVAAAMAADRNDREDRTRALATGRAALGHVLEIIGQQQQQALETPPLAPCDLTDIVAQNAAIARYAGDSAIVFTAPSQPHWAVGNRVILSQVIGNLLANASEAIAAGGRPGGEIAVSITKIGDHIELTIRDDGEGFDAGVEARFFQRGFSTRDQKSGGLGLHWCANAMLAMGGSLRLESDGIGTGARATIVLDALNLAIGPVEMAA